MLKIASYNRQYNANGGRNGFNAEYIKEQTDFTEGWESRIKTYGRSFILSNENGVFEDDKEEKNEQLLKGVRFVPEYVIGKGIDSLSSAIAAEKYRLNTQK